ncbi:Zinc finger BED domain-containing-like protein, partial [Daphnia magna]
VYWRHIGEHIKELILECIFSYGISANQIYSLTTDNNSNMIKSVQLFLDGDEEEKDIDFDELNINNDEEEKELVINELSESIRDAVRGFRCAAHTLQLAVLDVLKLKSVDRLIGKPMRR